MMLYQNRYRTETTRLKTWDYSNNGFYFITICTKDRIKYFCNIKNGKMILNKKSSIPVETHGMRLFGLSQIEKYNKFKKGTLKVS